MRRTPYSQRNQSMRTSKLYKDKAPTDLNNQINKIQINAFQGQDMNLPKNRYQGHLTYRTKISPFRRPVTTTRNMSFNYQSSKKQDHQSSRDRTGISRQPDQRKKIAVSLDQKKRQLLVTTLKEAKRESPILKDHDSKGRIYRGSSWKPEQKVRHSFSGRQTPSSRYINIGKNMSHNNQSRLSTEKGNRTRKSESQNSGYIMDLIGRNLAKPFEENQDNNFFQYVMRFSYRTKKGFIPSNSGKVNQDAYIMTPNINGKTWQHFFSVCDGHGPLGHHVSAYIKNNLSNCIAAQKNLQKNPKQALEKAFNMAYNKLIKQSKVDMTFSGSTVIGCYLFQNKLFSCNVGDSRAIIGKSLGNRKWKAEALSTDHKPDLQEQAKRIRSMNGRVQAYRDEFGQTIGPLRVWIKNDNIPGLAMTRSFGDLVGASVGVSPIPEIKEFTLTQQDKILIIGSDGVFQFLNNKDIIESLVPYYEKKDIQQASDFLMNKAHRSWLDNSSIIDDITFIMIFLNYGQLS